MLEYEFLYNWASGDCIKAKRAAPQLTLGVKPRYELNGKLSIHFQCLLSKNGSVYLDCIRFPLLFKVSSNIFELSYTIHDNNVNCYIVYQYWSLYKWRINVIEVKWTFPIVETLLKSITLQVAQFCYNLTEMFEIDTTYIHIYHLGQE